MQATIPGTDIAPGPLSFGAAPLGNLFGSVEEETATATLEAAWTTGIRCFDTAPHYGLGLSERRVGAFLAGKPRNDFVVSTKVGRLLVPTPQTAGERDDTWFDVPATSRRVWDYSERGIRRSHEDSLVRLGIDRVDVLYLHDPEQYGNRSDVPGALRALVRMRDEGLVRAVGVGSADVALLREAIALADLDLLMVSNRCTLLDASASVLTTECRRRGIGIVAAGVFNSGLTATARPRPDAHFEYGDVPPGVLARANALADACEQFGIELPAAALQYPLREEAVLTAVVGMRSVQEVHANAARMNVRIPAALWAELRARALLPD